MKIDRAALRRPCTAELLPKCAELIEELKTLNDAAFVARLATISDWHTGFGKTELARWADVLDKCDAVLERAAQSRTPGSHQLMVDSPDAAPLRSATIVVLKFTALLFENTFTRSMYSSADRLLALLDAGNIEVVTEVLRLFYVMSKRSRFLSQQLSESDQKRLTGRLSSIAESWGGRFRNLTLSDCCTPGVKLGSVLPISYQSKEGTKLIESVEV
uniref:DUF908 domain-containing protein n=1 Tax=Plectus sambesii TaxID=2011161 RepID=A0A914X0K1_9BILA